MLPPPNKPTNHRSLSRPCAGKQDDDDEVDPSSVALVLSEDQDRGDDDDDGFGASALGAAKQAGVSAKRAAEGTAKAGRAAVTAAMSPATKGLRAAGDSRAGQYAAEQKAVWTERVKEWMAKQEWLERQMPLVFAVTAGAIGGQSVMLAKFVIELVKTTGLGMEVAFKQWETYVMIIFLLTCLIYQTRFLNAGLARYDALVVIPMYQCMWIFFNILGGAIAFDELKTFTLKQAIFFPVGSVLTFVGISLLAHGDHQEEAEDKEALEAGEMTAEEVHDKMIHRRMSRAMSTFKGAGSLGATTKISHNHMRIRAGKLPSLVQRHRLPAMRARRTTIAMSRVVLDKDLAREFDLMRDDAAAADAKRSAGGRQLKHTASSVTMENRRATSIGDGIQITDPRLLEHARSRVKDDGGGGGGGDDDDDDAAP